MYFSLGELLITSAVKSMYPAVATSASLTRSMIIFGSFGTSSYIFIPGIFSKISLLFASIFTKSVITTFIVCYSE